MKTLTEQAKIILEEYKTQDGYVFCEKHKANFYFKSNKETIRLIDYNFGIYCISLSINNIAFLVELMRSHCIKYELEFTEI